MATSPSIAGQTGGICGKLPRFRAQPRAPVLLIGCDPKSDTTSLLFGGKACPTIIETSSKKKLAGEQVAAREAHHAKLRWHLLVLEEMIQRRDQLAGREVAARAKNDDGARFQGFAFRADVSVALRRQVQDAHDQQQ